MENKAIFIRQYIEHWLLDEFNGDVFLVELTCDITDKLTIFMDRISKNITLDDCVFVSKYIENWIEENAVLSDSFSIEVSSPGIDTPLLVPLQYQKQINKKIVIVYKNGNSQLGILQQFDNECITILPIEHNVETKKNKMKKKNKHLDHNEILTILFRDFKNVIPYLEFKL